MFTVKATYRSEIRKFSFPTSSFPTYSQINDQVNTLPPHLAFLVLTVLPSCVAYCLSALPIILLVSFLFSLQVLLLLAYLLVWRPIQRKSMNNMFDPSVVASGQAVSFASLYMMTKLPVRFQTPSSLLQTRMMKMS